MVIPMTPTAPPLAAVIAGHLESRGISEQTAAAQTNIPRTTLRRRLAGVQPFTADEVFALSRLLNTTASKLRREAEQAARTAA